MSNETPSARVLRLLRENCESPGGTTTDKQGRKWSSVYLDNARAECLDLTGNQWAGCLSVLQQAGEYLPYDGRDLGVWGDVRLL